MGLCAATKRAAAISWPILVDPLTHYSLCVGLRPLVTAVSFCSVLLRTSTSFAPPGFFNGALPATLGTIGHVTTIFGAVSLVAY